MRHRILLSAMALFCLLSCLDSGRTESSPLMKTVPSRSLAVMHFGDCSRGLALLLDSTHVFRNLDYGRLKDAEMILSYDYGSALVPLLCLDAGRASADTSSAVKSVLKQAEAKGLNCLYTANLLPRRAALLLSPSRASIAEALEHINSGASILDVHGFAEAESLACGACGSVFLKNGSSSRLLPKNLLKEYYPRQTLVRFFSEFAEWTVLNFKDYSREGMDACFWGDGSRRYLCEVFSCLEAGKSLAADAVPSSADLVLCLPLADARDYLSLWRECLDLRAGLSKYKGRLAGLKKGFGKAPDTWFAEVSPRELVLVRWDGHEVLLLRPAKKPKAFAPQENPYPGYAPALLGEAFRIGDDSFRAAEGGWLAFGSQDDVAAWLEAEKGGLQGLPRKARYYMINKEFSVFAGPENTILNVN